MYLRVSQVHFARVLAQARFAKLPFLPHRARESLRALSEVSPLALLPAAGDLGEKDVTKMGSGAGYHQVLAPQPIPFEADVQIPSGGRFIIRRGELVTTEEVYNLLGGLFPLSRPMSAALLLE